MKSDETKELEKVKSLLRLALDQMNPRCLYCEHMEESSRSGDCVKPCKWTHEDEALALIGGNDDAE